MKATSERPTRPGYYWYCMMGTNDKMVRVFKTNAIPGHAGKLFFNFIDNDHEYPGFYLVEYAVGLWSPRIEEPDELVY